MKFTVITGMSGSGKTNALHIFEDLGYYCVDNIPISLIKSLIDTLEKRNHSQVAVVCDVRMGDMIDELIKSVDELRRSYDTELIFLDSTEEHLVKRYKETRRTHPLDNGVGVLCAISREREIMEGIKAKADAVIDTSDLSLGALSKRLMEVSGIEPLETEFELSVVSFGFKHGILVDADMVYDVRCFPNPFYVSELKHKTGNDKEVRDFVLADKSAEEYLRRMIDMTEFLIPVFKNEGRHSLRIAVGCTGGHHRSVTFANALGEHFANKEVKVHISHRDITL